MTASPAPTTMPSRTRGQPYVQDDRAERARLCPPGQDVEHLAGRDPDGAEGEGGQHGDGQERGEDAEHQDVTERPPRS